MTKLITHSFSKEWESLEIYPLNDLHIGDPKTDLLLFNNFKKYILAQENRYIILCGDLINNAIKSSVSNVYSETMSPGEQKKWIINALKELKPRILGITSGNHEARTKKESDVDITEDIAERLGLEDLYSEEGMFLKISVGEKRNKQRQYTYVLHALHGSGGGKFVGSAVNNLENYGVNYEGVDIFVCGHVHGIAGNRSSRIIVDPRNNVISQRDVLYVISGAFQDYGGYAAKMMLRPRPKGATPIILSGTKKEFYCKV